MLKRIHGHDHPATIGALTKCCSPAGVHGQAVGCERWGRPIDPGSLGPLPDSGAPRCAGGGKSRDADPWHRSVVHRSGPPIQHHGNSHSPSVKMSISWPLAGCQGCDRKTVARDDRDPRDLTCLVEIVLCLQADTSRTSPLVQAVMDWSPVTIYDWNHDDE
jgi:hypothetical protein